MEIRESSEDGVLILHLGGNFEPTDVAQFCDRVEAAIGAQRFLVVIDTEQLRFLSSVALGALIRMQKRLRQHGGDLSVACLPPFAVGVFRVLGIDLKIVCTETVTQAVDALRAGSVEPLEEAPAMEIRFVGDDEDVVQPIRGHVIGVGVTGLAFSVDAAEEVDLATVFPPGVRLLLRFHLSIYHERHSFTAEARVEPTRADPAIEDRVTVEFLDLSEVERRVIQQFVLDHGGDSVGPVSARDRGGAFSAR